MLYSFLKGVFIPYGKYRVTVTESGVQLLLKSQYRGRVGGKERLLYFGCWQVRGGQTPVQRLASLSPAPPWPPPAIRGYEVLLLEGEVTWRNSSVSSDSHLEIGHQLSDQQHLD